jgi:hypothetical protein
MKRMTLQQTPDPQIEAFKDTVNLNGLNGIGAAGWVKAATPMTLKWRNIAPVSINW